ncbi:MAG: HNH endonuclease, partial [Actinobacteria bacterium]
TVLLAPLDPADDAATTDTKIQATAAYLDILLAQRLWTFRLIAYSTLEYAMFVLARDIRRKPVPELVDVLAAKLDAEEEKFASNERLYVHQQNRRFIHYLLARMTSYIEVQSGAPSHFVEYLTASGNAKFEVEHIWADKYERHTEEFAHENDFREYRNRIGDLLLLPKSFNAAYGALPYEDKLPHYFGQNILAQSLSPLAYERNPGFVAFKARTGLEFEHYDHFMKADLDKRGMLYLRLAEAVWSKDELLRFRSTGAAE